jgi:hypothetical protein
VRHTLSLECHLSFHAENTIYCIGGIGGKGGTYERRLESVECLEVGEGAGEGRGRWRMLASMSTPRSSHTCEVMDGLIYVVGGGDGKDWLCSAEVSIFATGLLTKSEGSTKAIKTDSKFYRFLQ